MGEFSPYIVIMLPKLNDLLLEKSLYYLFIRAEQLDGYFLVDLNMIDGQSLF